MEYDMEKQMVQQEQERKRNLTGRRRMRKIKEGKFSKKNPSKTKKPKSARNRMKYKRKATDWGTCAKKLARRQKGLGRDLHIFKEKRNALRENARTGSKPTSRTTLWHRKDIYLGRSEKSRIKAPPPPAPNTKGPPTNLIESPPKSPTKSVQLSQVDDIGRISGAEERGNIVAGPVDLTKPEQVTGTRNLMTLSIAELKDELERNRYVAHQRSSHKFKLTCDQ